MADELNEQQVNDAETVETVPDDSALPVETDSVVKTNDDGPPIHCK